MPSGAKRKDITEQRFGRLIAVRPMSIKTPHGKSLWSCRCDCGGRKIADTGALTGGHVKSCGCMQTEHAKKLCRARIKHGHSINGKSRVYNCWAGMIARCTNPKNVSYRDYGGRGIKVCRRWLKFDAFLADMGEPPTSPRHSLDRINNEKGYTKKNCRWATYKEQANNRRAPWWKRRLLELDPTAHR